MLVRDEAKSDWRAVHEVNASAFGTQEEARLVDRLRMEAKPLVSLVAESDRRVVGHILFTPVTLANFPGLIMGLAPMAVLPGFQRRGIGSRLVRAGLERCRSCGACAVVVLGHANYYPRFGFVPAARFGLRSEYDAPEDAFMAMELRPGALAGAQGTIRYHVAFGPV